MTAYYYAQINSQSVCHSITQLAKPIALEHVIAINSYDESYLGMFWDGVEWSTPEPEQ